MTTTDTPFADPPPLPSHNTNARNDYLTLHLRGIAVALCLPLAVFMYKFNPDVHDSMIDVVAKGMMWAGLLLIGPFFVAPCFNERRFGLLWYTATIPIVCLMWTLNVGGFRG